MVDDVVDDLQELINKYNHNQESDDTDINEVGDSPVDENGIKDLEEGSVNRINETDTSADKNNDQNINADLGSFGNCILCVSEDGRVIMYQTIPKKAIYAKRSGIER